MSTPTQSTELVRPEGIDVNDTLALLKARGFVYLVSDEEALGEVLAQPNTVYCGYDPTAPSLHVGNLLSIMALRHLQDAGHRPIVILGGATGLIGDPSGKSSQRPMLSAKEVNDNLRSQLTQFRRFLDFDAGKALILNNADWLWPLLYLDFLRDIGRHFTVNQLLQHETYRERLQGEGLSFIEFNYALLQAYDFLHLFQEYDCRLQLGGADQWFNICLGTELIRRVESAEAYGLVSPLLTTSTGRKMGKSEQGAIWLDPERTSPYAYYQYWINTEDGDVGRFLKLYTFLPVDEIDRLGRLAGGEVRLAKEVLAFEATRLCHGVEAATEARHTAQSLFGGDESGLVSLPILSLTSDEVKAGISIAQAFVTVGLCRSRSEAKRLIEQGGVSIDGKRIEHGDGPISDKLQTGPALVRLGKKRHARIAIL